MYFRAELLGLFLRRIIRVKKRFLSSVAALVFICNAAAGAQPNVAAGEISQLFSTPGVTLPLVPVPVQPLSSGLSGAWGGKVLGAGGGGLNWREH